MPETTPTVTLAGAADILGVSRQRTDQLTRTDPAFPKPVLVTDLGRRWARDEIETYRDQRKAATS